MKDLFTQLIHKDLDLEVTKELQFHPKRKWRFDYAIPEIKVAIEVEGGVWTQGRHTRGKGFIGDMEKYNQAVILGWRLIRVTPDTLITGNTISMISKLKESYHG